MCLRLTIALVVAAVLSACSTIEVRPAEYPTFAAPTPKVPTKVSLVLPAGFRDYHHVGSPAGLSGSLRTFDFALGRPIEQALRMHLARTFILADPAEAEVTVEPALDSFWFAIDDDGQVEKGFIRGPIGGALASSPAALTELRLSVVAYDKDRLQLYRGQAVGRGAIRSETALSFSMERYFTASANHAIFDATDAAVAQIPRRLACVLRPSPPPSVRGAHA